MSTTIQAQQPEQEVQQIDIYREYFIDNSDFDPSYINGKIYIIYSPTHPSEVYVGSTKLTLEERFNYHKYKYHYWKLTKQEYFSVFDLFDAYNDCIIELVTYYSCNNKNELQWEESYYQTIIPCINRNLARISIEESEADNICDVCQGHYKRQHITDHNKSKKHIANLSSSDSE